VLATNVQGQKSGKVNNKATGRASQTYAANPAAARGPQFDSPKTIKAMLLFIQLFVLTAFVFAMCRFVLHRLECDCSMRLTMKILETVNKAHLVPAQPQVVK
jgi:hypothetical protein